VLDPNSPVGTSLLGHPLDFITYRAICSMSSAMRPAKIGKELRTFPSRASIATPSCAGSCRVDRMNSYISRRVLALICLCCGSSLQDFDSFGGIGNNATSRTAIDAGLLCRVEGRFPRIRYTGHAFLSPEKFMRWVSSAIPMMGISVAACGSIG